MKTEWNRLCQILWHWNSKVCLSMDCPEKMQLPLGFGSKWGNAKNIKNGSNAVPVSFFRKLGGNPIVCDCSLTWFLREDIFKSRNKKVIQDLFDNLRCASPAKYKGFLLKDLDEYKICPRSKEFNFKAITLNLSNNSWRETPFVLQRTLL